VENMLIAEGYETDKGNYLKIYYEYFHLLTQSKICLLELGVKKGGSLLMWRDFFKKGTIVGLDINPVDLKDSADRIHIYTGLQQDEKLLNKIRNETAENGFDIIIDDASHIGELTSLSFKYLFDNHLKPGGIYVIEDWRTGYWGKWPDGKRYCFKRHDSLIVLKNFIDSWISKATDTVNESKNRIFLKKILMRIRYIVGQKRLKSHDYGMVGFVKQLVDELGMDMITNSARGSQVPFRKSKFLKMDIYPGLVFVIKNHDIKNN
jgi:SAM-dependent methyltransferase